MTQKSDWIQIWSWTLDLLSQSPSLLIFLISKTRWINWFVGECLQITFYCHYQKHLLPVFYSALTNEFMLQLVWKLWVYSTFAPFTIMCKHHTSAPYERGFHIVQCSLLQQPFTRVMWLDTSVEFHRKNNASLKTTKKLNPTWLQTSLCISTQLLLMTLKEKPIYLKICPLILKDR